MFSGQPKLDIPLSRWFEVVGVDACTLSHDAQILLTMSRKRDGGTTLDIRDMANGECQRTLKGHSAEVRAYSLSGDGQIVVSASEDKTLKIWCVATGVCLKTLEGHADIVTACALSYDGQTLMSGSNDGVLKIWDVTTGKCQRTLKGHTGALVVCRLSIDWVWYFYYADECRLYFLRLKRPLGVLYVKLLDNNGYSEEKK